MMQTDIIYNEPCLTTMAKLPDSCIDLILTDPPYLTTKETWDKREAFTDEVVKELFRVAKDSASIYVWCGIGEKSQSLIRWFPILQKYFYFKDLITWKKRRGIGVRKGWLYTREEILWFVKNNKKFIWNKEEQYNKNEKNQFTKGFSGYKCLSRFKRYTNVWTDVPEVLGNKQIKHFTPKPKQALERIIKLHTQCGDVVYDPFLGSGSTAQVCKNLDRRYIGSEISKTYFDFATKSLL